MPNTGALARYPHLSLRERASAGRAALELMRVLSDAREAAWGVVQAHVSELVFDFDGYAGKHFARLQAAIDGPGFGHWLADVAA